MDKNMVLTTDRLVLRVLKVREITVEYIACLNDPQINKFLVTVRLQKQTLRIVSDFVKSNLADRAALLLGIFVKSDNTLIGTVRIHNISYFHYSCILGICLFNKKYWGKGYASEALQRAVKFIFEVLKLHHIEAGVYKANTSSVKLFRRAGFRLEASFKDKYRHMDSFREVLMFGKVNRNFDNSVLSSLKRMLPRKRR